MNIAFINLPNFTFLCLCYFFLSSCKYKTLKKASSSQDVYISVVNRSLAPQFGILLKRKIKEMVSQTDNYKVVNSPNASDLEINVLVKSYEKEPGVYLENDPIIASSIDNRIGVEVFFKWNQLPNKSSRESFQISAPSLRPSERSQALSRNAFYELAENFSRKIRFMLLDLEGV